VVLQDTTDFDYLYASADGGRSFAAPVNVGTLGVTATALVSGQIVFGTGDNGSGAQTESIPVSASGPPAGIATPTAKEAFDYGVGSYRGGVLVGSDYDGTKYYTTYVEYAPPGADFNTSSSYRSAGSFAGQTLIGSPATRC
jgi:hypothetical protein